jgi:mannose/cellobiose epimerase-like protein (N-acyl-D-glucosamine 2-epimerase family)
LRASSQAEAGEIARHLRAWIVERALPLWATAGLDARRGGFQERLRLDGTPDLACDRRLMVQARQAYVYAHAAVLGWHDGAARLALRGVGHMLASYRGRNGLPGFADSLTAEGAVADARRDTYAHAFVLLALGWTIRATGDARFLPVVDETLAFVDEHLTAPDGSLLEGVPHCLPRRQNPHMHMFEAMLALHETIAHAGALPRARRILDLLRVKFVDPETQTLREYFDAHWQPAAGQAGDVIEPGHHAEWAWLLRKYQRLSGERGDDLANALTATAARFADARGLLIDEADRSGALRKPSRRLWPQTEMAKAWLAAHEAGQGGAAERAGAVLQALADDYLAGPFAGGWHDRLDADGRPDVPFVPASAFYHLFTAIAEADRVMGTRVSPLALSRG